MRPAWPECPGKSPPRRNRSAPRAHPARPGTRRLWDHPFARFLGGGAGGGLGLAKFPGLDDTPSPTRTKRFEGGGIGSLAIVYFSVPASGEALTNLLVADSELLALFRKLVQGLQARSLGSLLVGLQVVEQNAPVRPDHSIGYLPVIEEFDDESP